MNLSNERKVDKSKKSNIKCEHCEYFANYTFPYICLNEDSKKHGQVNYWNRCKRFKWAERYNDSD